MSEIKTYKFIYEIIMYEIREWNNSICWPSVSCWGEMMISNPFNFEISYRSGAKGNNGSQESQWCTFHRW